MKFDVETTIRQRKSIRVYDNRPLQPDDRDKITAAIDEIMEEKEPFPADWKIQLLESKAGTDTEKLGTYGVIKGAGNFLCVTAKNTETAMEAIGYHFEKLVLTATALELGTCWLAGTFNRDQFSEALRLEDDEIFPIVCPIGYPSGRSSLINTVFRKAGRSDQRFDWPEIFFDNGFDTPLPKEDAGAYQYPLEMLRLAPSAANRQPWRIVRRDKQFHFYRKANPSGKYSYDLQRLDVGIGACHFHLAAMERGLDGTFTVMDDTGIQSPDNLKYLFSWQAR